MIATSIATNLSLSSTGFLRFMVFPFWHFVAEYDFEIFGSYGHLQIIKATDSHSKGKEQHQGVPNKEQDKKH